MSQVIQQKITLLQGAEQSVTSVLQKISQSIEDQDLQKALQKINQATFERVAKLGQAIGALKMKVSPRSNPATEGIVRELEQSSATTPGPVTDTNIVAGLQKLLAALATDYSFTANLAYQQKQDGSAVKSLSDSLQSVQKLNEELSGIAQRLFKKVGSGSTVASSSSSSPQSSTAQSSSTQQKPGILQKAKQAVTAARQAIAQ